MAIALTELEVSTQEYLVRERQAEFRHEYVAGQIYAMSGASFAHNVLVGNIFGEIRNQMKRRPCHVFMNDMRVRLEGARFYTYPDVAVCGTPRFEDGQFDTLLNPTVILEVLSPSTANYDRGEKFVYYRQIASLQEYVLISPDSVSIELYTRQGGRWNLTVLEREALELHLTAIDCHIPLTEIYDRVELEANA